MSPMRNNQVEKAAPVQIVDTGSANDHGHRLIDSTALCLSGGGYRAMLFHVGAICRLNELGYLPRLARISSVSGGSITAGVLGMNWGALTFEDGRATNLDRLLVEPIRRLASRTIDVGAGI